MKKFLLYVCLTLLAVIVADRLFSLVVDGLTGKHYVAAISRTEGADDEIAIIGSSRASHHYDPQIIADSLGMTVHNYGIEGTNIYTDVAVLSMLLNHAAQKPKMVILDLSESDVCDVPQWNAEHLSYLFPYVDEPVIDSLLADVLDPREHAVVRLSALYRHNSRFLDYLKSFLTSNSSPRFSAGSNGMNALNCKWEGSLLRNDQPSYDICVEKMRHLEQFIQLCKSGGIDLVVATSPYYKQLPATQHWVEEIRNITREHNVTYLYYEQDADFLSHPDWFNEPYHLNATGAAAYTKKIIPQLNSHCSRRISGGPSLI
jgi:hypothetical protein